MGYIEPTGVESGGELTTTTRSETSCAGSAIKYTLALETSGSTIGEKTACDSYMSCCMSKEDPGTAELCTVATVSNLYVGDGGSSGCEE